jgi:surface polysaccharide O-acyltransferase-like enzyme
MKAVTPSSSSAADSPTRAFAPDFVRAVAMLLVVLLHASMRTDDLTEFGWWASTTLHTLSRISVPLFFLLSGWLLLNAQTAPPLWTFYLRRASKILVPLVVWSAFSLGWRVLVHREAPPTWSSVPKSLLNGSAYYHLWFLPIILKLSLLAPLLLWLRRASGPRRYLGAMAVLAAIALLACVVSETFRHSPARYLVGYGGYFVLGGLIGGARLTATTRLLAWCAWLLGWALTLTATYWTSAAPDSRSETFLGFQTANIAVSSIGAFLLLIDWAGSRQKMCADSRVFHFLRALSACSLGVYVLHPFALELCWLGKLGSWVTGTNWPALAAILFHAVFALTLCAMITAGLRASRLLRPIVP